MELKEGISSLTSDCTIKVQYSKQYRSDINRNIFGSWRNQRSSKKTSTSAQLTILKPLTVWVTTNYGKFLKMEIPDHLSPEKPVCRSRNNS